MSSDAEKPELKPKTDAIHKKAGIPNWAKTLASVVGTLAVLMGAFLGWAQLQQDRQKFQIELSKEELKQAEERRKQEEATRDAENARKATAQLQLDSTQTSLRIAQEQNDLQLELKKMDLDEKKAEADRVWRNRFDIVLADFHSQDDVLKANAKLTEMSQAIAEQSVGFHFHAHWTS